MKKFAKKLAAALMAGTLILGMAVTSFAKEAITDDGTVSVTNTSTGLTKTWEVADNTMFNDTETFTFTLTYAGEASVGTNATAAPKLNGTTMAAETTSKEVVIDNVDWADLADDSTEAITSKSFADIFDGITFSQPGVYSFTLSEEEGSNANIDYSEATYTIKVQITWDDVAQGTIKVDSICVYDINGKKVESNIAAFKNTPVDSETLTIYKEVTGNAASKNDEFEFTVKLTDGVSGTYKTSTGTIIAEEATFTLIHGQRFEIYNLPVGASYTITETDNGGYTVKSVNGVETENATYEGTIVKGGDNKIEYVNEKTVPSVTGLFLNFAPFVLIFAVAVAGCFVFFRSRRTW